MLNYRSTSTFQIDELICGLIKVDYAERPCSKLLQIDRSSCSLDQVQVDWKLQLDRMSNGLHGFCTKCSNPPSQIDSIIIIGQSPIIPPPILILSLVKQALPPQLIHLSPKFRIVINKKWILQLLILHPFVISLLTTSSEFVDEAQRTTINEVGNAHNLQHPQMSSREKPHLHVDEELKVFALILIDVDTDMMSHTNQGQKLGKNSSTETHRVPMGLVGFKK